MKIAMIGSGAAGSVFAAYLRKGGAELWLVDKYKAHMDKIAADGLVFRTPEGEEVLTGFHTSATAHDIGTMDMVILMVKATQTAEVMADTMPCIGPETVVVSLQNGLGNDEVLAQLISNGQVATQYVGEDGKPSMDLSVNPNGSALAIEGITSPDGRVFGKMGHSERSGEQLYKNVTGDKYQPIFEGGVNYFKL